MAREALSQITKRLRSNLYREKTGSGSGGSFPSSMPGLGIQGSLPMSSGYSNRHEPGSPGGMYSSLSGLGIQAGMRGSSYQNLNSSPGAWGIQVFLLRTVDLRQVLLGRGFFSMWRT